MNTKYPAQPEIIGTVREINIEGEEIHRGSKVVGIQVLKPKQDAGHHAIVQIDIQDFKTHVNVVVEFELHELAAALTLATLNAQVD